MFVYFFFLCKFVPGLIFWFLDELWFDDLRVEWIGDRLYIVFSRDVVADSAQTTNELTTFVRQTEEEWTLWMKKQQA